MIQNSVAKAKAVAYGSDLQVTSVHIKQSRPGSKFVANATVTFFDQFVIKGLRLRFKDGLPWITYPADYSHATATVPPVHLIELNREARTIVRAAIATAYSMVFNGHVEDVSFEYNEDKDFLPEVSLDFTRCDYKHMADVCLFVAGIILPGIQYIKSYKGEDLVFYPSFPEFKKGKDGIDNPIPAGQGGVQTQAVLPKPGKIVSLINGAREDVHFEIRRVYGEMTGNPVVEEIDPELEIALKKTVAADSLLIAAETGVGQ
jgi:DNA-binding cell septation regulator SpoVG